MNKKYIPQNANMIFLLVVTLMGLGLVQVYSSSFILATENFNNGIFFVARQALAMGLGLMILFFFTQIPHRWIAQYSWLLFVFAVSGVVLTLIPGLGIKVGGASRWLQLPFGLRYEPSELLKITYPIVLGTFFYSEKNNIKLWHYAILLFPLVLLLRQPDFGSVAIISIVLFSITFSYGLKWRYILLSVVMAIPAFYFLVWNVAYRKARVFAFLDPWADPEHKGFQIIQSMLTFRNGGLTGQGLGQSQGKLFFLPEAHTDFTLAVFGEETGFIGVLILFSLYGLLITRMFQLALQSEDKFRKTVILGIALTTSTTLLINAGVVLGVLPPKGLTLPFLSYGGSSLITYCLAFGLVLNCEKAEKESGTFQLFTNKY